MRESPEHYLELGEFYAEKRDRFIELMADTRFTLTPSRGTYFQLADYGAISDARDTDFARWLTVEHGVAVIPISVFYADPPADARLVRFCFAKQNATLEAAAERLVRV
jgi:methionine aminotransferase